MTLQDFFHVVSNAVTDSSSQLGNFLPNLIAALVVFIIGLAAATLLQRVWLEISRILSLEKSLVTLSFYQRVIKEDKGLNVTDLAGTIIWWFVFLVFLFATVTTLGIKEVNNVASAFSVFVPSLIIAALYLAVGSFVAFLASRLVSLVGTLTGLWGSEYIARFVTAAVVIFALLASLKTLGVSTEIVRWLTLGAVVSVTLGLAVAGKELYVNLIANLKKIVK